MLFAIITSIISAAAFLWLALRVGALNNNQSLILMKVSELQPTLTSIETVLEQIRSEVTALVEATRDVDLPVEAVNTLDRIRTLADHVESIIPETPIGTSVAQV